jgi:protein O-GlcNAc transferase
MTHPDFLPRIEALLARRAYRDAAALCAAALAADPNDADALHMLVLTDFREGRLDEAARLIGRALELAPATPRARYNLGCVHLRRADYPEALACFDAAALMEPGDPKIHNNRAGALLALNRAEDALAATELALRHAPRHLSAWLTRAAALAMLTRLDDAEASLNQALTLEPRSVDALLRLGELHQQEGRFEEAEDAYARALAIEPALFMALSRRAACLLALARHGEALALCDRALAARPKSVETLNNRGVALHGLGRDAEAIASFDAALALSPHYPDALCNRGNALVSLRLFSAALAAYDAALRITPDLPAGLDNRGALLLALGRSEDGARDFERLLAIAPHHPTALANLLFARRHHCDWRDHDALRGELIAGVRSGRHTAPPFAALALFDDPGDQLRCASAWAARHYPPRTPLASTMATRDKIRIGYLSGDFHAHPTAYLALSLFEQHNRVHFDCIAFSYGPAKDDPTRAALVLAFDEFIDASEKSDPEIAALIQAAEIDILVDLKGYTFDARPGILSRRPAPVQVSFLGFPGTLGAPYCDYIIADPIVLPAAHETHFTERAVRLPHSYQPNSPRPTAPPTSRADHGLREDAVVLANFNNAFKLTPILFAVWMRILETYDDAMLWLYAGEAAAKHLRDAAARAGVSAERLIFAPHVAQAAHIERLRHADLMLDTAPYGAHTTASDALWAGVPVLTVLGETFASRVGASLNAAAGMTELTAPSLAAYEKRAIELVQAPPQLAAAKQRLHSTRDTCALFHAARYTHALERAYVEMARRAREGTFPSAIDVADDA